jgi:hypothetical protein
VRVDKFFASALDSQTTALVLEESPRVPSGFNIKLTGYLSRMRRAARENSHWKVKNVDVRLAYPFNGRRGAVAYKLGMSPPRQLQVHATEHRRA